jgi:hypothetical protein
MTNPSAFNYILRRIESRAGQELLAEVRTALEASDRMAAKDRLRLASQRAWLETRLEHARRLISGKVGRD